MLHIYWSLFYSDRRKADYKTAFELYFMKIVTSLAFKIDAKTFVAQLLILDSSGQFLILDTRGRFVILDPGGQFLISNTSGGYEIITP